MIRLPRHSEQQGFTLVELLVVVSIIALLIAILLPSLRKAREQARTVKCLANLHSMGTGVHLYAQDHSSTLPGPLHPPIFRNTAGSASGNSQFNPMHATQERPWFLLYRLAPYFTKYDNYLEYTDAVATCPTAEQKNPDSNFLPGFTPPGSSVPNPNYMRPYHYLPNCWPNTAPVYYFGWVNIGTTWQGYVNGLEPRESPYKLNSQLQPPSGRSYYRPKSLDILKNASAEWMIGDAWLTSKTIYVSHGSRPTFILGTWQIYDPRNPNSTPSVNPLLRKPIHTGDRGTNLVYFDCHAESFMGVDPWVTAFPANLRGDLTRP